MKKLGLVMLLLCFCQGSTFAQDIIILNNGDTLLTKIVSVTNDLVTYKKYKDSANSSLMLKTSKVNSIQFQDGRSYVPNPQGRLNKEHRLRPPNHLGLRLSFFRTKYYLGEQSISRKEFLTRLSDNPKAYNQYRVGRRLNRFANIVGIPAGMILAYQLGGWHWYDDDTVDIIDHVAGAAGIIAILAKYTGFRIAKHGTHLYNQSNTFGYRMNVSEHGVGIAIHW